MASNQPSTKRDAGGQSAKETHGKNKPAPADKSGGGKPAQKSSAGKTGKSGKA